MTCWYVCGTVAVPHGPDAAAAGDAAVTPAGVAAVTTTMAAMRRSLLRTSTSRRMLSAPGTTVPAGSAPHPPIPGETPAQLAVLLRGEMPAGGDPVEVRSSGRVQPPPI